jgi:hypothetical protein
MGTFTEVLGGIRTNSVIARRRRDRLGIKFHLRIHNESIFPPSPLWVDHFTNSGLDYGTAEIFAKNLQASSGKSSILDGSLLGAIGLEV